MTPKDFLEHFKTIEEIINEDPTGFPAKLSDGFFCVNKEKARIEFICADPNQWHGGLIRDKAVAAWIDFSGLGEKPLENFNRFKDHIFRRKKDL